MKKFWNFIKNEEISVPTPTIAPQAKPITTQIKSVPILHNLNYHLVFPCKVSAIASYVETPISAVK